jgi:predicted DNA-binding transcriptional regulator AlpA
MSGGAAQAATEGMEGAKEPVPGPDSGRVVSGFASLAPETLLDETAVAQVLRVSKRTVRRMVARYELPPPVPFGGRSFWQVGRVVAWFERRADRLEREARRRSDRIAARQLSGLRD